MYTMERKYKLPQTNWSKPVLTLIAVLFIAVSPLFAQGSDIEMADAMRQDGKIWVVVGVIVLIFIGIITYLISLDAKISKLEKQIKKD